MNLKHSYSFGEELLNSVSHGLGLLLSVAGLTLMVVTANNSNNSNEMASAIVFGSSLIMLYLSSTLYHAVVSVKVKNYLKLLDHCAIYVLIAGTYTPFLLLSLADDWGYPMFAIVWTLAFLGVSFKLLFRHKYPKLSLATYLVMGWLIILLLPSMLENVATNGMWLLAAGGLSYSIGAIFYAFKRIPYNHAIWHLFVLGGSICHFLSVYLYVM